GVAPAPGHDGSDPKHGASGQRHARMSESTRVASSVLVFDVNETLLDVRSLAPMFGELFGTPESLTEWFLRLLHASLVETVSGGDADFATLARSALATTAERRHVALGDAQADEVISRFRELPVYPEVPAALRDVREAGFVIVTLTNSPSGFVRDQLAAAGIVELFEAILSVDEVGAFKPAPEPYRMAAARLGVPIERIRMVAAHDWDVAGALRAGALAAFVARPGMPFSTVLPRPDVVGRDLREVAARIMEIDQP
ncbi:MAG: haloacid dehalogenase type II, partial [Actinobacteria bacterium]|nr:haloacid dehalogenase type II [Actinomycetota bacterium]